MSPFPLVVVVWLDAWFQERHINITRVPYLEPMKLRTVGWQVYKDDSILVLSSEIEDHEAEDGQARQVTVIPKISIVKIKKIKT